MCEVNYSEPSQTVLHEGPDAKLDAKHVKTRKANGTYLHYVEGWHVIAEANRIFGYDVGSPKAFRPEIDKSVLTFGEPNRIPLQGATAICRQQPCLSRGRSPSHAHHVRYAQSKGLRLKVSDEFTVPLCAIHHHNTLVRSVSGGGRATSIPLVVASGLWRQCRERYWNTQAI